MRTLTFLVVATTAGAFGTACGGRSELFSGDGGVTTGSTGHSGGSGNAGATGNATGSTGSTGGFGGSTGFTGGTGTGFSGDDPASTGTYSGSFTGSTGTYAGSFAGSTGSYAGATGTGYSGTFSGTYTGSTGASGASGGYSCPAAAPAGFTCSNGSPPPTSNYTNTGSQCVTTFECNPDITCSGSPSTVACIPCDGGVLGCGHLADLNGLCTIEYCPPSFGATCTAGAACAAGSLCTLATAGDDCLQECNCNQGSLECAVECNSQTTGACEPGAVCNPPGSACQSADPCVTCVCEGTEYSCGPSCFDASPPYFLDGGFFDASLPHDAASPQDAEVPPDALEILSDF